MPVTRITRFGFVNAYLVEEDDGLTLVDTMLPRSAKAILEAAGRRSIERIVDSPARAMDQAIALAS